MGVTTRSRPVHSSRGRLELRPERLRRRRDPTRLRFASTSEVELLLGTVGQPRALYAHGRAVAGLTGYAEKLRAYGELEIEADDGADGGRTRRDGRHS